MQFLSQVFFMSQRNHTIKLSNVPKQHLVRQYDEKWGNQLVCGDIYEQHSYLPDNFVDLLILDPPYNITKKFGDQTFKQRSDEDYLQWVQSWFTPLLRCLKPTATLYFCGDWRSSAVIYQVLSESALVRNRITWEREKGRGAQTNWKNTSEDIWYATMSDQFTFNVDAVKLKRRVIAPYKENGVPKDWDYADDGEKYRLTYPSNLWTDISVPFWSMPENTDHPTQKPEKLIAKLILASSNTNDVIFDPFAGSGTTLVVAEKLGRRYIGIELEEDYCHIANYRINLAKNNILIQGYKDGIFLDRNYK
jgi:site-specific DNA-methyltransferase (adenine-specific)